MGDVRFITTDNFHRIDDAGKSLTAMMYGLRRIIAVKVRRMAGVVIDDARWSIARTPKITLG
jgi:hypothetical protein